MSDAKSTILVEREQPGRFPAARFGGVVWTRQQGATLREMVADEPPEEDSGEESPSVADKFNEV